MCILTFYNIQPKNVTHNIHIPPTLTPSHCAPTEPSRNIPTPSQSKQTWPPPAYGAFHYHPAPHFSPRLPLSGSAGSRRSRFIQQSAVRSGPAQHARPSHATGSLGADSPNNRNATVAPRGGRETFIIDRVYADDVQFMHSNLTGDVEVLKLRVTSTLHEAHFWFVENSLKINPTKTEVVLFKTRQRHLASDFSVSFNNTVLRSSSSAKVLGIVVDENLSWEKQVSLVVKRCYATLHGLSKFCCGLSREV